MPELIVYGFLMIAWFNYHSAISCDAKYLHMTVMALFPVFRWSSKASLIRASNAALLAGLASLGQSV